MLLSLSPAWLRACRSLAWSPCALNQLMRQAGRLSAADTSSAAVAWSPSTHQHAVPISLTTILSTGSITPAHRGCSSITSSWGCPHEPVQHLALTSSVWGNPWTQQRHSHTPPQCCSVRHYCSAQHIAPFSTEPLDIRCVGRDFSQRVTLKRYRLPGYTSHYEPGTQQHSTASSSDDPYLQWAVQVVERLRSQGHAAYFAGGWVRDAILNRASADIDIVTSANVLQELPLLFSNHRIHQMQRSTARIEHGGMKLEVAQFKGARKLPDLDSLYYDACSRDFTINALYYDPLNEQVLDFVDGVTHLQQRVLHLPPYPISTLSMPSTVIAADPLRVLRAVRFCVSLGLTMSEAVKDQIRIHGTKCRFEHKAGAGGVGNRRLFREFTKVCATSPGGDGTLTAAAAFEIMAELGLLDALFPDIVMPEAATCRDLQLVLNQVAGGMDTPGSSSPGSVPAAMRVLVLIDPGHGLASKQVINSLNAVMFQHLGAAWDNQLLSDAELITDLLTEVRASQDSQATHPGHVYTLSNSKTQSSTSHLAASLTQHPQLEPWGGLTGMKVFPFLEAWILAWLDPKEQQLWQEAVRVVQQATATFAAPPGLHA